MTTKFVIATLALVGGGFAANRLKTEYTTRVNQTKHQAYNKGWSSGWDEGYSSGLDEAYRRCRPYVDKDGFAKIWGDYPL